MNNKEKYDQAFIESFSIDANDLNDKLEYNSIQTWDSVGHMGLIAALEEQFDIMMEMDDIIDFSSYQKGFEIVAKYEVVF
jgi:acyl carrier protein